MLRTPLHTVCGMEPPRRLINGYLKEQDARGVARVAFYPRQVNIYDGLHKKRAWCFLFT